MSSFVEMIINNSKIFAACAMIMMNIGGKYIQMDLPKSLDTIFQNIWMRRLVIFAIAFVATRDVRTAFFITLLFILIFSVMLNEKSQGCLLPETYLDLNKDGKVTPDEIEKAKQILKKASEK